MARPVEGREILSVINWVRNTEADANVTLGESGADSRLTRVDGRLNDERSRPLGSIRLGQLATHGAKYEFREV